MPYERHFDPEKRWFEAHFSGKVTVEEIIQNYMEMIRSPEWGPDVLRLIVVEDGSDLSDITLDVFQTRFLQVLDETKEIAGPPNKNAWVMESPFDTGIGKVWEMMPEAQKRDVFRIFRTRQAAVEWLEEGSDG